MSILEKPELWASIDASSMYSLIEGFPDQLQAARQVELDFSIKRTEDIRALIVTGLGGSAIGGDLVRSVAAPQLRLPLLVNRDYSLPAFAGPHTLVFACSYSGNTEETLSAYRQARQARCPIVCVTSGGQLGALAKSDGFPVLLLPSGLPPRAALGYSLLSVLMAMQAMELVTEIESSVDEAIELLKRLRLIYGSANLGSSNPAMALACSLHGKIAAIYASSAIMEGAAFRWRSQIAENSKNLAFHHVLPEMNHNELVGWMFPAEVLKQVCVVLIRDQGDHPQVQRRFDLTRELIAGKAGSLHEVWSQGDSLLARVLSITYLGDFVSLYLAYLNKVDPTPVQVIDYLKRKLSGSE